ncbi:hypothetical protein CYMTET_36116 [Cymbomonas tetramitiformis]|uniref:Uncharacterized protein n=1 Tax=Cymbomonas tetramitiformis TaxID=36881 RepID=A0AAE0CIA9_9CHLO|nr:hypothetical protein CYMTET_36116 [Cymbomonas tetramitiformis]
MKCVICGEEDILEDDEEQTLICRSCGSVNSDDIRPVFEPRTSRKRRVQSSTDGSQQIRAAEQEQRRRISNYASEVSASSQGRADGHGFMSLEEVQLQGPPSDTLVGLQVLRAQTPKASQDKDGIPVMLKTQLYSIVKDRTEVDRELDELRQQKIIRLFKLNTGADDYAIMFTVDYAEQRTPVTLKGAARPRQRTPVTLKGAARPRQRTPVTLKGAARPPQRTLGGHEEASSRRGSRREGFHVVAAGSTLLAVRTTAPCGDRAVRDL